MEYKNYKIFEILGVWDQISLFGQFGPKHVELISRNTCVKIVVKGLLEVKIEIWTKMVF